MNEAAVVQELRRHLRRLLPHAVVFKHNDLTSAGIPDLSINHRHFTLWLEVKYLREGENEKAVAKHLDPLQLASLILLEREQLAYYLLAYRSDRELRAAIYSPKGLRQERLTNLVTRNFLLHTWYGSLALMTQFLADLLH